MIEKLNSKELNSILVNAISEIKDVEAQYQNIEKDILNKISIMQIENEYKEYLLCQDSNLYDPYKIIFTKNTIEKFGNYDEFGQTIHPKISGPIIDIFNSQFENKALFKNNMFIKVNDNEYNSDNVSYKNYLMNINVLGKQYFIDKYTSNDLNIEVQLDTSTLLGSAIINTIEINPFLQGSFNIKMIKIYQSENDDDPFIIDNINNVMQSRIILKKPINFYKAIINITLNYKDSNNLYPFGLKSIRFLNVPYSKNSNIIVKFNNDHYIRRVNNQIKIKKATDEINTTFYDQNIKLFLDNNDGILSYEIEPGISGTPQDIARNVKAIYLKIPLDESISSLTLLDIAAKEEF